MTNPIPVPGRWCFGGRRNGYIHRLFFVAMVVLGGAGAAAGDTPATVVVDHAGREIEVKDPFTRIISLYGAHTENLFSLGLGREIIGVGPGHRYPPAARDKPTFSYHDGPEKFLAAGPDLLLIRPMIDRAYPKLIRRLETCGIVVCSLQPGDVEAMYQYWRTLGILTGRREAAGDMICRFQQALTALRAETADGKDRPRVYFEAIHDKMKTFTPGAMAIFVLEAAGGINAAADAMPVRNTNIAYYGKERILARAREIDVYIAQRGAMNQISVERIRNEPGFSMIKAIQNGRVYIVDETIVSRPTLRLLKGIRRIKHMLYPEQYPKRKIDTATGPSRPAARLNKPGKETP